MRGATMRAAPAPAGFGLVPKLPLLARAADRDMLIRGGAPVSGGITPINSPEVDALRSRLEAAEVGLASMKVRHGTANLTDALTKQTNTMVETMAAQGKNSIIRIEPRITWPKLGDDGTRGREV